MRISLVQSLIGAGILAASLAPSQPAYGQSSRVEVWIRAFIPDPANAGGGATFIKPTPNNRPGSVVRLQSFTEKLLNQCFATDHRGFSSVSSSTARAHTRLTLALVGTAATVTPTAKPTTAGVTHKIDCTSGEVVGERVGSIAADNLGTPAAAGGVGQVIGSASITNSLVWGVPEALTPSIDYSYDLKWTPATSSLALDLTYGQFPAMEVYARQPGGPWTPVLRELPGNNPLTLTGDKVGIVTSFKRITVTVRGLGGTWRSEAPAHRFTVKLTRGSAGPMVEFTERNSGGQTLTRSVAATELPTGGFRFERANDEEVLTFLGFQPSLRAEIRTRQPQPSFAILSWEGDGGARLEWSGLLVTKDSNARLKELFQPGTQPPKVFRVSAVP